MLYSLAEVRYALIFAGLGFDVEFEPDGDKGPDLGIKRDGEKVVVEIMRFRKINSGLPLLNLDDENLKFLSTPTIRTSLYIANCPNITNRGLLCIGKWLHVEIEDCFRINNIDCRG